MTIAEKIYQQVQHMPKPLQTEILDFVEYLELKRSRNTETEDNANWANFSLANAMRDMEEDEDTSYSINDLKERF